MQIDRTLIPPAIFGGLIAIGLIGAGIAVGGGVVNANTGNRQVTVRGVAERNVDRRPGHPVAALHRRRRGAARRPGPDRRRPDQGPHLPDAAQGYADDIITIGRLEVTDTQSQSYAPSDGTPHYIVAQSVTVRTTDVARVAQTERALNDLVRQGVLLDFTAPTYVFTKLNDVRPAMIARGHRLGPLGRRTVRQGFRRAAGPDQTGDPGLVRNPGPRGRRQRIDLAGQAGPRGGHGHLPAALERPEKKNARRSDPAGVFMFSSRATGPARARSAARPAAGSARPEAWAHPAGPAGAGRHRHWCRPHPSPRSLRRRSRQTKAMMATTTSRPPTMKAMTPPPPRRCGDRR